MYFDLKFIFNKNKFCPYKYYVYNYGSDIFTIPDLYYIISNFKEKKTAEAKLHNIIIEK